MKQGGRRVADGGDRAIEPIAPKFERGGAARGAEFLRKRWHGRGVKGADDLVAARQARWNNTSREHFGIAQDRRSLPERLPRLRHGPIRKYETGGDLDHSAGVNHAHRDMFFIAGEAGEIGLGADRREGAAVDFRSVAEVVEAARCLAHCLSSSLRRPGFRALASRISRTAAKSRRFASFVPASRAVASATRS